MCAPGSLGEGARPHIAAHTRRPAGASHPPGRKSSRALPLRPCGLSCVRNFPQWNFGPPMSVHRRALWPSRSRVAGGCTLSALLCAQPRHFLPFSWVNRSATSSKALRRATVSNRYWLCHIREDGAGRRKAPERRLNRGPPGARNMPFQGYKGKTKGKTGEGGYLKCL